MEKKCSKCLIIKDVIEFNKKIKSSDGYRSECKICQKEYYNKNKEKINLQNLKYKKDNKEQLNLKRKEYYLSHKDEEKERNLKRYNKNKNEILEKQKIYNDNNRDKRNLLAKNYRNKNPHIMGWRYILNNSLKRLGKIKEEHTIDLLGYSALELKNHLESLFTEGMSWENYGEWHIDHIIPVSKFEPDTPMNIVNALSNLQPLWGSDNIRKSDN